MANRHFGKFADVWKHLVLDEVVVSSGATGYAETHAGSAAYPMVRDGEREYGVLGFLEGLSAANALSAAAFPKVISGFVDGQAPMYPGSALQAMSLRGNDCAYFLCDVDPVSADDLRRWAVELNLTHCDVMQADGRTAVPDWLRNRSSSVVHIDPFDPFGRQAGGFSALEVAAEVADRGHTLVYWYGFDTPDERAWALDEIRSLTKTCLWCGDFMISSHLTTPDPPGDLGMATSPGTGCGIVLANVSSALTDRCEDLAHALVDHYEDRKLPNGELGRLDLSIRVAGTRFQSR